MAILAINSGSSSLKYGLFDMTDETELARGTFDGLDSTSDRGCEHAQVIRQVFRSELREHRLTAVGHRVVHGGSVFEKAVRIDKDVLAQIHRLNHLAPLHNPACLQGIEAVTDMFPDLPQVAVFDTSFYQSLPEYAWRYALPKDLADRLQIRRYGFHGTSHQYVASRAAELLGRSLDSLRLITLHLGNGASAAAIRYGECIDTSMGMTPLEGLVMGTRAGDMDPSIPGYLQRHAGMSPGAVDDLLNRRAGLRGLCGDTDMRLIRSRAAQGDADARLAIQVYSHRLRKYVGAYMAILEGCDGLVFTGGIGEHDASLRAEVCDGLKALGIHLDPQRNRAGKACISFPGGHTAVLVIPTNEEWAIAQETHRCLSQ